LEIELSDLITLSHTAAEAAAYRSFVPTEAQLKMLGETGKDVLLNFPVMPAACAMMSALYAARLQMSAAPAYVVAGAFSIGTTCLFGKDAESRDWKLAFSESNPSWDGHCWVMFGNFIADVSIFRTAYSYHSPPLLKRFVAERFGKGRGLLIGTMKEVGKLGFNYQPQYVLTESQITGLIRGAERFFV
jgi:hypothetical protein